MFAVLVKKFRYSNFWYTKITKSKHKIIKPKPNLRFRKKKKYKSNLNYRVPAILII